MYDFEYIFVNNNMNNLNLINSENKLIQAIFANDEDMVRSSKLRYIRQITEDYTALILSIYLQNFKLAELLLEEADISTQKLSPAFVLIETCDENVETISLLHSIVSLHPYNFKEISPLIRAIQINKFEFAKVLVPILQKQRDYFGSFPSLCLMSNSLAPLYLIELLSSERRLTDYAGQPALFYALREGNLRFADYLIQSEGDIIDNQGFSAACIFVMYARNFADNIDYQIDVLKRLIICCKNCTHSPLILYLQHNKIYEVRIIKTLIIYYIKQIDCFKQSALMVLSQSICFRNEQNIGADLNHCQVAQILLMEQKIIDFYGNTALIYAIQSHQFQIGLMLVEEFQICDSNGITPLMHLCSQRTEPEESADIRKLAAKLAASDQKFSRIHDNYKQTALMRAAVYSENLTRFLINLGLGYKIMQNDDDALLQAVKSKNFTTSRMLLAEVALLTDVTPMMALCDQYYEDEEFEDALDLLILIHQKQQNVFGNQLVPIDAEGKTALMRAASKGYLLFCQMLLMEKDSIDNNGYLALDYGFNSGDKRIVRLLTGSTYAGMQ